MNMQRQIPKYIIYPSSFIIVKTMLDQMKKTNSEKKSDEEENSEESGKSKDDDEDQHCSEESCDEIFFSFLNLYRYEEEWILVEKD